jgi:DNA-binding response OmpR family regulator
MYKILLIDDEKPTLTMFRLFLGAYGYEVLIAEDGAKGLDLVQKEKPPIVFTDIKMPGMDGLEVLKRIKAIAPETEVIVITGHGDMDIAVKALDLDATDYIHKPVQRNALDAALRRAEKRLQADRPRIPRLAVRSHGKIAIFKIDGDINARIKPQLEDAYAQANHTASTAILMQFDPYGAINREGIDLLIGLLSQCKKRGQSVALTGLTENDKLIFDLVGIIRFAEICEDEAKAITFLENTLN